MANSIIMLYLSNSQKFMFFLKNKLLFYIHQMEERNQLRKAKTIFKDTILYNIDNKIAMPLFILLEKDNI